MGQTLSNHWPPAIWQEPFQIEKNKKQKRWQEYGHDLIIYHKQRSKRFKEWRDKKQGLMNHGMLLNGGRSWWTWAHNAQLRCKTVEMLSNQAPHSSDKNVEGEQKHWFGKVVYIFSAMIRKVRWTAHLVQVFLVYSIWPHHPTTCDWLLRYCNPASWFCTDRNRLWRIKVKFDPNTNLSADLPNRTRHKWGWCSVVWVILASSTIWM